MYDIIIIGMGPGGIAASIYAKRSGLKVLCLESNIPGGILNYIDKIDNYPGLPSISGASFAYKLLEQIESLNIEYKLEKVLNVKKNNNIFDITTSKNTYQTKKIIIATGRKSKKLGLENEDKFLGRGISHCAVCDAAFFKNKTVTIVGGGDSALQETLYLENIVSNINIVIRRDKFRADKSLIDKVINNPKITIYYNDEITSINGNDYLTSVTLKSGKELQTDGLFIYIGYEPSIDYLEDIDITDSEGYAIVNNKYETKCNGIYAIGDIIKKDYYQIITAMSEGAQASLNISKELEK